jgi:hypothetical protein
MFAVALELSDFRRLYAVLAAVFAMRALFGDETLASRVCAFVDVGHVTILRFGPLARRAAYPVLILTEQSAPVRSSARQ